MSLHDDIAALHYKRFESHQPGAASAYATGWCDARDAAAELALKADARIAELETALRSLLVGAEHAPQGFDLAYRIKTARAALEKQ